MISIIVFSKTYASSRWCLEELVKIVECKEKANQVILPVFYDVDPSKVRKQTGGFGKALAQHQQRFGTKRVSQWKTALTKVANFSGWDLQNDADGYESKLIDKIVEKVLQVVNQTFFNVAKYPVGIHTRGNEAIETMIINLPKEVHLSTKVFSKMSRLRLLRILSMNANGPLKYLPKELRLLVWNNCPLKYIPSDLCLKKLVILEITNSNI
ncbi:PREDICTED: disease resistance protein ADR2-like [Ipomoea nil]|uniref:disease resistance protein ADR2-like n=1 Tax=Ipomoea nil TaxID=35883 RepID=UPI000901B3AA|nr:PREDICTED: disease resistance protein ADR2-like [Ipomoea nil]XP_019157503.1 PREDICTED: disease resistance protein ADR2-like [Ipomoea nil]